MISEEELRAALEAAGLDPDGAAVVPPKTPAPHPSQDRGGGAAGTTNYRDASADDFAAELAKYNLHPRRY